MQINIQQISQIGKRQNNEDFVSSFPEQGLFIVCDGVGGNNKGEVASKLACETISEFIRNIETPGEVEIKKAVSLAENELANFIEVNPESEGMATTLALLSLSNNNATIAHIGDSRVYHIRDGQVIFQTQDHSLVNEYIASGFISQEEAKNHPKKNVITRAIQTTGEHTEADIKVIEDIQANDFFILCSDGILEGIDNAYMEANFLSKNTLNDICTGIEKMCSIYSNDNYSGIFIKVIE
ncbi:MAG: serine/threonine-protein phosphatase [Bacteroidetes bacterium]|nr:serine/threonine-protein phosphatase [Bacteroidota bacterium]